MSLRANDLKDLISPIFEIDTYKSKIGNDSDFMVISFTADLKNVAEDLEKFIELGCNFVIDADSSNGENDNGKYKVFIEMERNKEAPKNILKMIYGIKKLTGHDKMYFRYFKNFKSRPCNEINLNLIPTDKLSYEKATSNHNMNDFSNFFADSYVNDINVLNESIIFNSKYNFNIVDFGKNETINKKYNPPILLESVESLFFTKIIGNYDIMKISENKYSFRNKNYTLILEYKS